MVPLFLSNGLSTCEPDQLNSVRAVDEDCQRLSSVSWVGRSCDPFTADEATGARHVTYLMRMLGGLYNGAPDNALVVLFKAGASAVGGEPTTFAVEDLDGVPPCCC